MRFEQTRDILEHVQDFHHRVSEFYDRLEARADQQRTRLLLDYLGARERQLADALGEFIDESSVEILDSWFQFTNDEHDLKPTCPEVDLEPDMSVDEVLNVAAGAHDCITKYYRAIAASSNSTQVREVFAALSNNADKEWQKLMRNAQMLMDL